MTRALCLILIFTFFLSCRNAGVPPNNNEVEGIHLDPEVTIQDLREGYNAGDFSIEEVVQFYIDRIREIDQSGYQLNAIRMINPEAREIARQLDEEWHAGQVRGPLHGIPVLLKDNIDTGDGMPTTAGARAMVNAVPREDSPLAAQLREAGAVILGKANLSEWANFHSDYSSSGWSGLGGQVKNPYDLTRNPCGSSSGSAVAVAANLTVLAIGTETNGSIVCPANNNGIVGIKPTVGLISRRGIIPLSFTQDTGGPMARTVRDAVICLGAMTTRDSADAKTLQEGRKALDDYTPYLRTDGIEGKRIGYWKSPLGDHVRMTAVMEEAVEVLRSKGAEIIEIDEVLPGSARRHSFQILLYEFKDGLNKYLSDLGPDAPVRDLDDLIEQTFSDSIEMRYFDHALLKKANEKGDLTEEAYLEAVHEAARLSRQEGIDKVLTEHDLDAIVAPTGGPAWKTDLTNGDRFGISSSSPAAIAGYPNITVPMGQLDGLPVGMSIFGPAWSEPTLIEIAYAYEQNTMKRMTPGYVGCE